MCYNNAILLTKKEFQEAPAKTYLLYSKISYIQLVTRLWVVPSLLKRVVESIRLIILSLVMRNARNNPCSVVLIVISIISKRLLILTIPKKRYTIVHEG